jgi:DNA-binding SARP family transcriptional activator
MSRSARRTRQGPRTAANVILLHAGDRGSSCQPDPELAASLSTSPGRPPKPPYEIFTARPGAVKLAIDQLHLAAEDLRCAKEALTGGSPGQPEDCERDASSLPAPDGVRARDGRPGTQAPEHASIEFRLLGSFRVLRAGREIANSSFGGRQVRQLVKILLSERGRVVPRDVLIDALWPEREPADPEANLAVLASRARHALGESSLILARPGGYVFPDDDRCWVDTEAFAADAQQGRRSLASGDAAAALRSYRSALALWAGDPFMENLYQEWAQGYRRLFSQLYEEALEGAARAALELGQAAVALHFAGILVERVPLHEGGQLLLMRAHAEAGDPAAAIGLFHDWRRLLADELGLDPCSEAFELYQRIVRREPSGYAIRPERHTPSPRSPAADEPISEGEMMEPAREILDQISDAVFVLDPGRCFIYVNRRGAELAGCPASCLIGRTACEIFPEEWSPGFFACAETALSKKAPGYFRGFYPPIGAWLDAALYPGAHGLLAVLRDVTRQVLAEEQVHRALAEVEASRSELEDLAARS